MPHRRQNFFRLQLDLVVPAVLLAVMISSVVAYGAHFRGAPTAPTSLRVTATSPTSLSLAWNTSTGRIAAAGYDLYLNGARVTSVVQGSSSYTFSGLSCGTAYKLGVDAYNSTGITAALAQITAATTSCTGDQTAPTAPASIHLFGATSSSLTVGWDLSSDNTGVTGYGVYVGASKATTASSPPTALSGLSCGTQVTVGVDAVDANGNRSPITQRSMSTAACPTSTSPSTVPSPAPAPTTTTTTTTTATSALSAAANLFVAPGGNDSGTCAQSAPCASLNGAYQRASAGDTVQVAAGTFGNQVIAGRAALRNLSPGCTPSSTAQCVHFVGSGVRLTGTLEIHGSSVWIDGGSSRGFDVAGYIDTEADSDTSYPDHVIVQGTHSSSFGVFNANTVTFQNMDVGPATVTTGCALKQGPGIENKIGFAGNWSYVPRNVTLDGLRIHDQNGDVGRIASDCHFGGLFLVTANGLTIKNTVFERNVVYNVQIQNFGGAPRATNVTFTANSFGCPVDWLYKGAGCDNQASIQFDGTFPGISITGNVFAGGDYGCYVGTCDYSADTISGNTVLSPSTTAPPLP